VQDAVNLGWKLAQVVQGTSPPSLLDTYTAERHPVAARVQELTKAQVALAGPDERHQALRDHLAWLLDADVPRTRIAGLLSQLDVHYDLGDGHPLLGRRLPDLDLQTDAGPTRAFALLHEARPVLLVLDGGADVDLGPWADRVRRIDATYDGNWELPVLGDVEAPRGALVRPDGYVAWTGAPAEPPLADALARWFGPAAVA
jgi:hypothetical protein